VSETYRDRELCRDCTMETTGETIARGEPYGVRARCSRCGRRRKLWKVRFTMRFDPAPPTKGETTC
jgi:hypothetical protein